MTRVLPERSWLDWIIRLPKLINGHVTPLDGNESNDPRLVLPFAKYAGTDEAEFLKAVRNAAASSAKRALTNEIQEIFI